MGPKYEFTNETITVDEVYTLTRIRRISDGVLGGFIETENNLSQDGDCWVADNAKVYDNAEIRDNAIVKDNAEVYGVNACIHGNAEISGNAVVNSSTIYDNVKITDNANVFNVDLHDNVSIFDNANLKHINAWDNVWIGGDTVINSNSELYGNTKLLGTEDLDSTVWRDYTFTGDENGGSYFDYINFSAYGAINLKPYMPIYDITPYNNPELRKTTVLIIFLDSDAKVIEMSYDQARKFLSFLNGSIPEYVFESDDINIDIDTIDFLKKYSIATGSLEDYGIDRCLVDEAYEEYEKIIELNKLNE